MYTIMIPLPLISSMDPRSGEQMKVDTSVCLPVGKPPNDDMNKVIGKNHPGLAEIPAPYGGSGSDTINEGLKLHTESNLLGLASKSFTFEKVPYSKKARRNQVRLFDTILK